MCLANKILLGLPNFALYLSDRQVVKIVQPEDCKHHVRLRNDCLDFQVYRRLNLCCLFANYIIRQADHIMFAHRQHRFYLR
jgi:hypothetical protein